MPQVSRIEVVPDIVPTDIESDYKTEIPSEAPPTPQQPTVTGQSGNGDCSSKGGDENKPSAEHDKDGGKTKGATKECSNCKQSLPYGSSLEKSDFERHALTHLKCGCANQPTFDSRKAYQDHMKASHEEKKLYK